VGAGQDRQADTVYVLLDGGSNDLLRGLVQTGVDNLDTGITEGTGNNLGPTIVAVQARFTNKYS
jgi:hypothetical protein